MRKILIYLAILALVHNGANAGLFGDDVDLADLSQLSPDALETLKDTEFNVFLTKVEHAGAKILWKEKEVDVQIATVEKAQHAETKAILEAKNLRMEYEKISKQ